MPRDRFHDAFSYEGDALERAGFKQLPEADSETERDFDERVAKMAARMQTPEGRAAIDLLFDVAPSETQ